jgi:hypothetical protein
VFLLGFSSFPVLETIKPGNGKTSLNTAKLHKICQNLDLNSVEMGWQIGRPKPKQGTSIGIGHSLCTSKPGGMCPSFSSMPPSVPPILHPVQSFGASFSF